MRLTNGYSGPGFVMFDDEGTIKKMTVELSDYHPTNKRIVFTTKEGVEYNVKEQDVLKVKIVKKSKGDVNERGTKSSL